MATETAPQNNDEGRLTDPVLYKELQEGLLQVFRNNVALDQARGGWREYPNFGEAAAQAAMALLQLEKQKPVGMK